MIQAADNCQLDPLDGYCHTHHGECPPVPLPRSTVTPAPAPSAEEWFRLPIAEWAWREDGRQLRA